MFEELQKSEERYEALEQLLASHEVIADKEKYNKLAKELSDLKDAVLPFREYKKVSREIEDLAAVLKEKHDKEFADLARKEYDELEARKAGRAPASRRAAPAHRSPDE